MTGVYRIAGHDIAIESNYETVQLLCEDYRTDAEPELTLSVSTEELTEILRKHLRKGDIVTHYAPSIIAMLLPTANYQTGQLVMERIQMLFYKQYPNSDIPFHYRLGMLGEAARDDHSGDAEPEE